MAKKPIAKKIAPKQKPTEDEIFPDVSVKIWTEIVQHGPVWSWSAFLLIGGMDDQYSIQSANRYSNKKQATDDLVKNFKSTAEKLVTMAGF